MIKKKDPRQRLIKELKAAGLSVVQNAENIVTNEPYLIGLSVTIKLSIPGDEFASIDVNKEFIPEKLIENARFYEDIVGE